MIVLGVKLDIVFILLIFGWIFIWIMIEVKLFDYKNLIFILESKNWC